MIAYRHDAVGDDELLGQVVVLHPGSIDGGHRRGDPRLSAGLYEEVLSRKDDGVAVLARVVGRVGGIHRDGLQVGAAG